MGYCPWVLKESDTTERLTLSLLYNVIFEEYFNIKALFFLKNNQFIIF